MKKRLTKLLKDGRSAAAASLPSSSSKFLANEQGAIAILAAVMLPVAIGVIALAVEFGHGLLIRDETQRVADEAAYAGALAYAATGNQTSMLSAAQNVAVLNGVATTAVAASLIATSPRDATSPAVQATITTDEPIVFGQVVGFGGSVTIKSTSYAEIPSTRRRASSPSRLVGRGRLAVRRNRPFGAQLRGRLAGVGRRPLRHVRDGQGCLLQRLRADGRLLGDHRDDQEGFEFGSAGGQRRDRRRECARGRRRNPGGPDNLSMPPGGRAISFGW